MRRARLSTGLLLGAVTMAGCGQDPGPTPVEVAQTGVATLTSVGGADQEMWAGRRSDEPFVVSTADTDGEPLAGIRIRFSIEGEGGGILSQPEALTDEEGLAETFLLDASSGAARIVASVDGLTAEFPFVVLRAPGEIRFDEGTGEAGLPGFAHPDSIIRVQVFDTEGLPLEGTKVWFAAPGNLANFSDITDVDGRASTVLRDTHLQASNGTTWAFILGFPELNTFTRRPLVAAAQRVVLISIDGLRGDAIERFQPPTLSRLAREGAFTPTATTIIPTLSVPAHLSLLSGVAPESHGVFSDRIRLTPEMASLDPLFRHARRRGRQGWAYLSREGPLEGFEFALGCRLAFGLDSLALVPAAAAAVAEAGADALIRQDIELVFLHLPDPDFAGHEYGWNSPEYGASIMVTDSAVARIVEDAASTEDVLIVITSGHGGGGSLGSHHHGSSAREDLEIPLILWGSRVPARPIEGDVTILDVAPTILWSLGMRPPFHYQGRILLEAFR